MARAPRTITITPRETDPIEEAVRDDKFNVADALAIELEKLGGIEQGTIKGILYKIPVPNGKYEWIRDVYPPFDMSDIMQSLKDEFGGGDYALRLMAEGKVRKTLHFSIMRTTTSLVANKRDDSSDMLGMFQLMSAQQQAASAAQMQSTQGMMQMMMQQGQQSNQMMIAMITAMMGNQGKPADMLPLITAMTASKDNGGLKEMVETLAVLKGLTDPAKESAFNADDIVGSVLKIAGPVAGAVGRAASGVMASRRQQGEGAPQGQPIQLQDQPTPLEFPTLPNPTHAALPSPVTAPGPAGPAGLIALIRPDVNYFFGRRHDVELAAEAVYGVISAALDSGQVSEADLNDMVTAFMGSPDWIGELAGTGVDLRADPAWAQAFLFALVSEHTNAAADFESDEGDDDSGRADGRGADLVADGQAQSPGLNGDEGATTRGDADNARI